MAISLRRTLESGTFHARAATSTGNKTPSFEAKTVSIAKDAEFYRDTIDGAIHLVTGIRGKGMTTDPAVARETIDASVAGVIDKKIG